MLIFGERLRNEETIAARERKQSHACVTNRHQLFVGLRKDGQPQAPAGAKMANRAAAPKATE